MSGRPLGSLASLAAASTRHADAFGFTLDDDEAKPATRTTRSTASASSLSSLAPLGGRPTSNSASSGLGGLTALSSRPTGGPSSFDLDEGFDALLSAETKPIATTGAASKKKQQAKSYDSASDESDGGGGRPSKKKEKKKKADKKRESDPPEDKSKRGLPTRKLPLGRPSTAPGDFDDDSLFGIKKETSTSQHQQQAGKRTSQSKSQSVRDHEPNDWDRDDDGAQGEEEEGDAKPEYSATRSAESTTRKVSAAMAAKEKRDQEAYEKQQQQPQTTFLPEPVAVPLKEDPAPAPRTFGRPRGPAAPSAAASTAQPAVVPNATPSPQAFLPTSNEPAKPAAASTAFHMPGEDEEPPQQPKANASTMAARTTTATTDRSVPSVVAAASKSAFDAEGDLPLDDGPAPSAGASPEIGPMSPESADPFGGLEGDPMDEIDEKQGNLFSGFGAARPATSTAPAVRARRALPSAGRRADPVGGRLNSAPPSSSSSSTVPASAAAPSFVPNRPPVPHQSSFLSSAAIASGPPGPCVPPNLGLWFEWLGVNARHYSDEKLVPIVHQAAQAKAPAGWTLTNGWWINSKTGVQHRRHPYLKHFLDKVDSKRLALKFAVDEEDDDDHESIVASGDESTAIAPNTPSSMHNRSGLFDDSHNPLSPLSPKTRRIEANSAHQPPPLKMHHQQQRQQQQQQQQQPSVLLSVNTASAPTGVAPFAHGNTTPSPYYASHAGAHPAQSPVGSTGADDTLPSRGPALQKLESVPERQHHYGGSSGSLSGSVEEMLGQATREKQARLAELDRQSQERLAAAAAASTSYAGSLIVGVGGGGDAGRLVSELQAQVRLQSITIEELEKRKRVLQFELENADIHLSQLLGDQRARYETQLVELERRARSELEGKKQEYQRMEVAQQAQLTEVEDRLRGHELRKTAAIAAAVQEAEAKARESMEHALRLAAQQAEAQRTHFERELESTRLLHQQQLQSLKQQQHDSVFLRSLVSQVEHSAANLDGLAKKVYAERNASERLTFDQLQVRDTLLKEKEVALDKERRQNEGLVATFQQLTREHDEEKARLREEHLRLMTLQSDIKLESAVLQEQLTSERDHMRKERAMLQQHRDAWEVRQKREAAEIELKREINERQHVQALEGVEEAQRERAEILKQLDEEREEIRLEKRNLGARRQALDARESTLRSDEGEFAHHVQYFEQRMGELHLLGAKVQKQSAEVADQYTQLSQERALIAAAKLEARQLIDASEVARIDQQTRADQFRQERLAHEKERAEVQAEKTKLLMDKEIAKKQMAMARTLAEAQAGLPQYKSMPPMPIGSPRATYDNQDGPRMYSTASARASPTTTWQQQQPYQEVLASPSFDAAPADRYNPDAITAALAALSSHSEHLRGFLTEEKILLESP